MTERQPVLDRLHHMLQAIEAIERLTARKTLAAYRADADMAAAVERYLERLSEASRHVPDELKAKHASIDWRGVADIGNALRHAYDQISGRRVWQTVIGDLPPLKIAIEAMLAEFNR